MTTNPQAAQLKRYNISVEDGFSTMAERPTGMFCRYNEAAERIATLERERDAAVRDAERYRAFKKFAEHMSICKRNSETIFGRPRYFHTSSLDSDIDEEIAARSGERVEGSNG